MKTTVWENSRGEKKRLRQKARLAAAMLALIIAMAATAIYSFAGDIKVLKTDLNGGVPAANPRVGHPDSGSGD